MSISIQNIGKTTQIYIVSLLLLVIASILTIDKTVAIIFGTHMAIGLILAFFIFKNKNFHEMLIISLIIPLLISWFLARLGLKL